MGVRHLQHVSGEVRSFGLSVLLLPSAGWKVLRPILRVTGLSPMTVPSAMWKLSCRARLRVVRAARSCKDSYTKKSCVRRL